MTAIRKADERGEMAVACGAGRRSPPRDKICQRARAAHLNPNERELWEVEKVEEQERGQVERLACEQVEKS